MQAEFGVGKTVFHQWPVLSSEESEPQRRWLIVACGDDVFSLAVACFDDDIGVVVSHECGPFPYSSFWSALKSLSLDRRKWWLIGFRLRYAIEKAEIFKALERGEIMLPKAKKKDSKGKRSGKLTMSQTCLEIDIEVGRNKVKIIDWKNLGLLPQDCGIDLKTHTLAQAESVLRGYLACCQAIGLSANKVTAAQAGWARYRQHHIKGQLSCSRDGEARAMERRAYFGGRNECFKLGDIPDTTFSLDVKSCYADICATRDVPIYMIDEYKLGLPPEAIDHRGQEHWIADVIVETPTADYPLDFGGQVLYPVGQFKTSLCWPELQHALSRGRIAKVIRAARYRAGMALHDYALWFQRAKSSVASGPWPQMKRMLKATFNASLGYTARQKYEWQPWVTDVGLAWASGVGDHPEEPGRAVQVQILDSCKEWLRIGGEPREALPMIHATICSWARVRLLEIFEWAGRENVLYCDTDGILTNLNGYANMIDSPGIMGDFPGQLCERFPCGKARIQGQKNYRVGENVVCAGLVATRRSAWTERTVLDTPTGRTNAEGDVTPFEFRCVDSGGEEARYVNELV